MSRRRVAFVAAGVALFQACGGSEAADPPPVNDVEADRCVVRLHGKGGDGAVSSIDGGVATIAPRGNAEGWGAWQWVYFPAGDYEAARRVVSTAVDDVGCESVVLNGFSNGAAFVAAMYCEGESLDGRLVGVVIDDPVTDAGTEDCSPAPGIDAAVYWTGALVNDASAGTDCGSIDWTCDGGVVIGIDEYASRAGFDVMPSPFTTHDWYLDAPEPLEWLAAGGAGAT